MKTAIVRLEEHFPKNCNRSRRLRKKLHLGEFTEYSVNTVLNSSCSLLNGVEDGELDRFFDVMVELMNTSKYPFMFTAMDNIVSFQIDNIPHGTDNDVKKHVRDALKHVTQLLVDGLPEYFGSITQVSAFYGNTYYGEWDEHFEKQFG